MSLPDPRDPPSKGDKAVHGEDCARHPLVGCIINQTSGTPEEQARSYLLSRRQATIDNIAGRDRTLDLTGAEYQAKLRELIAWHAAGNAVNMPPPILPIGHRMRPPATPKPEVKAAPPVQDNPTSRWPTWPETPTQH